VALQRSYLLLRLYAPELDCFISAAGSQILAIWGECDGGDEMTVALQRSYLLLRLYAPELDCVISAAGNQILAIWRECDRVYEFIVPDKIWVSPIFQISQISLKELTVIQPSVSNNTVIHFCSCKFAFKNFIYKFLMIIIVISFKIYAIIVDFYNILKVQF
jgi:hypothetical protein